MTTPVAGRRKRGESLRRQAERAVAQLHRDEVLAIKAEIEAGGDLRQIVQARRRAGQFPAADRSAVSDLAGLRAMVMERLYRVADGHEPWPGPLLLPAGVDFGQVDMMLYIWVGILYGVTLAQNALDGNPAATGRPIPAWAALWDAQFDEFWHGDTEDGQAAREPIGNWPPVLTVAQACPKAGAA